MDDKFSILKNCFGYTSFRPGQAEIIDALLAGRDVLAVLPTGAGKSICYQIPALLRHGLTIVVSPLIALMKDQVESLVQADLPAAAINSSLSNEEYTKVTRGIAEGYYKLIYIAPERLSPGMLARFSASNSISMVVIDEAHCVSQWGHDFRPSYLRIAECIRSLKTRPVTAAFTATATERVCSDINISLELNSPFFINTGFDRPNLYFAVQKPQNKTRAVLDYLNSKKESDMSFEASGIIYCATRKSVEALCEELLDFGYSATRYHAGLEDAERRANQDDFIFDRKNIMVATNAFGMGINKSNVSFVIHYNMPKNIESYYQEAGRAGRDGAKADCLLLYSAKDVTTNEFLIKKSAEEGGHNPEIVNHNLELLKFMTFYASTTGCLRARLLSYFNAEAPVYCGNCSNCDTHFEEVNITIEAQKIISCVLRLKQRGRRVGKTTIIQILRGSSSEKITSESFNTLSTYNIMKDVSAERCRDIIDYLIINGYLTAANHEFPVIEETGKAKEIIIEKKSIVMMLAKETKTQPNTPSSSGQESKTSAHPELLAKLKRCRLEIARAAQVPAYIIFNDATLIAMSISRPRSLSEFIKLPGVGSVKSEKYGNAFINCVEEFEQKTFFAPRSSV